MIFDYSLLKKKHANIDDQGLNDPMVQGDDH